MSKRGTGKTIVLPGPATDETSTTANTEQSDPQLADALTQLQTLQAQFQTLQAQLQTLQEENERLRHTTEGNTEDQPATSHESEDQVSVECRDNDLSLESSAVWCNGTR